ncbi:MAG TPA: response regulator [Candidatus Limnocylindrales bacterium]|nr:response regulator [Candidatus Limnocylindrales bacterium]
MRADRTPIVILIADDDEEDRMLTQEALEERRLANELRFVPDGEELMDYLKRRGKYAEPWTSPRPGLILLDLNMPKMDGRECLAAIKADEDLRNIPVFVLTTSQVEEDVHQTYELGGSSFISKPVTFEAFLELVSTVTGYGIEIVAVD